MSEFARYEPRARTADTLSAREAVRVRPAEVGDAHALAQIQTRREGGGDVEARRERFEELATSSEGLLLVAEVESQPVGYGRVVHYSGSEGCPAGWYLMGLIVSPEFRRRGIGERLTLDRLDWVAARDGKAFFFANERNLVTIDLHARLGFEEVTREFTFPDVEFQGGSGILFVADLTARRR